MMIDDVLMVGAMPISKDYDVMMSVPVLATRHQDSGHDSCNQ